MAGQQIQTAVGLQNNALGAAPNQLRQEKTGGLVTADAHGRFAEQALQGNLFSGGMTLTTIANATFSTATLTASATPIIGIYNPSGSGKNAFILQAKLQLIITALQVTGQGALMWCYSIGNGAISTGNTPLNRLTMAKAGSVMKDMTGVALTGLTNNLVVGEASALYGGPVSNLSTLQTAAGLMPAGAPSVENFDGSWVVPPGGVLALLCTTNAPVAISAASGLLWEEASV